MTIAIARLLDGGIAELIDVAGDRPWRGTVAPGDDLAALPPEVAADIEAHWSADVGGGQTRAERYAAALPQPEPIDLVAYANERKWRAEIGGIVFNGIAVPTDDRAKLLILGAATSLGDTDSAPMIIGGVNYGAMTGVQFRALNDAVVAHVQATITTMADVLAALAAGTITTTAEIDAAFAG